MSNLRVATRTVSFLAALAVLAFGAVPRAEAQPFGAYLSLTGHPTHGYVRVPHSAALNPTGSLTFETWVSISNNTSGEDCRTIAGKSYLQAWWFGLCNVGGKPTLRSYLRGASSPFSVGEIDRGVWTHIAITYDGVKVCHLINGEVAGCRNQGAPTVSGSDVEVRIGSDESWQFTPAGAIDEFRMWNVARSTEQIRDAMQTPITSAQPGLLAVWPFNGNANDAIGPHDGSLQGAGIGFLTLAVGPCTPSVTTLCLLDRFAITSRWRTNPAPGTRPDGDGMVVGCANPGSGLFWFFSPDNWEIQVKALNGCGLNNRYWVFSAATTNVYYRMEVYDTQAGAQRIYFNYPGPPAPAVTDTSAFATCP